MLDQVKCNIKYIYFRIHLFYFFPLKAMWDSQKNSHVFYLRAIPWDAYSNFVIANTVSVPTQGFLLSHRGPPPPPSFPHIVLPPSMNNGISTSPLQTKLSSQNEFPAESGGLWSFPRNDVKEVKGRSWWYVGGLTKF